jgi:lipopolysaccharide transport system ATP-binding protein
MTAIRVENLGKRYKHYRHPSHRLWEWATAGRLTLHEPAWVLRGVRFSVEPGEALGIVGPNGAGKSTLLRLIKGTIMATEGRVETAGRVAALELGLGFHPDFSGYENLFTGGALIGLDAPAVRERLPEIEAFTELGDALSDPMRTYSSGMQLRLAFGIATAVRPDILLIDEALAVGDAYFQHKCIARIRSFREQGTTLLLVAHDAAAVTSLCDRAILLESGVLERDGSPREVLEYYNALTAKRTASYDIKQGSELGLQGGGSTRSGDGRAVIERLELQGHAGEGEHFRVGEQLTIRVHGRANEALDDLTVGVALRDRLGNEVFGTNTYLLGCAPLPLRAGERFCAAFRLPLNLGCGSYGVTLALHEGRVHLDGNFDWWDNVASFQVVPGDEPRFAGTSYLPVEASIERAADSGGDST